jgi:hypothetical protein
MTLSCSYVVVGATVVGCSWYLTRLARGPHGELLSINVLDSFFRIAAAAA